MKRTKMLLVAMVLFATQMLAQTPIVGEWITVDDATGEQLYHIKLEWYDFVNPGRWYGLACTQEENADGELEITSIVEPYDLRVIQKEYTNASIEEEQPAESMLKAKKSHLYLGQQPVGEIKSTNIMYKK